MNQLNQKRKLIKSNTIIVILLLWLNVVSCSSRTEQHVPNTITPEPTPEYLLLISPTGEVSQDAFNKSRSSTFVMARGIAISIWAGLMDISKENQTWDIIKQRASLFLDGAELSDETLLGGADGAKDSGLFRLSWAPDIPKGYHVAVFQFVTDSGSVIEYKWQFSIK